jgi:hypothetical protein
MDGQSGERPAEYRVVGHFGIIERISLAYFCALDTASRCESRKAEKPDSRAHAHRPSRPNLTRRDGRSALSQDMRQVGQLPTRRPIRVSNNHTVCGIGVSGLVHYIKTRRAELVHVQHSHFEVGTSGQRISNSFLFGHQPCEGYGGLWVGMAIKLKSGRVYGAIRLYVLWSEPPVKVGISTYLDRWCRHMIAGSSLSRPHQLEDARF